MSQLKVNSIVPVGGVASGQGGGVIQVVSVYKGDRFTTSSTSHTDITGMSLNITPTSSSNKIMILGSFGAACTRQNNLDHGQVIRILRNGSDDNKLNGIAEGSRIRVTWKGAGVSYTNDHTMGGFAFSGVDDPGTTSQLTYKVQVHVHQSQYPFYLNGNANNGNDGSVFNGRTMSSLIAMEISG